MSEKISLDSSEVLHNPTFVIIFHCTLLKSVFLPTRIVSDENE